jgi:hypothetical protein
VDLRAGLGDLKKRKFLTLLGLELRLLGRPASSQSLYRLRHHGSDSAKNIQTNSKRSCVGVVKLLSVIVLTKIGSPTFRLDVHRHRVGRVQKPTRKSTAGL